MAEEINSAKDSIASSIIGFLVGFWNFDGVAQDTVVNGIDTCITREGIIPAISPIQFWNDVAVVFGIGNPCTAHMVGIFQHEVGHEVVFKVRIMWRCCRLDQEFFDKSMDIIESDRIPFVDHLDDGTHFRVGLVTSIPVWIEAVC